jgi:Spy/CpxP family protein refolding chaperone
MRRQGFSLVVAGILANGVLFAQQTATAPARASLEANAQSAGSLSKKVEKQFTHMTKRYKLTAEQQTRVKTILMKEQQDTQTVSADTYMSVGNRREEVASLREASQQQIGAVLNKKQKRKFDSDEKRRAWMDGRLPNPNPGPVNF